MGKIIKRNKAAENCVQFDNECVEVKNLPEPGSPSYGSSPEDSYSFGLEVDWDHLEAVIPKEFTRREKDDIISSYQEKIISEALKELFEKDFFVENNDTFVATHDLDSEELLELWQGYRKIKKSQGSFLLNSYTSEMEYDVRLSKPFIVKGGEEEISGPALGQYMDLLEEGDTSTKANKNVSAKDEFPVDGIGFDIDWDMWQQNMEEDGYDIDSLNKLVDEIITDMEGPLRKLFFNTHFYIHSDYVETKDNLTLEEIRKIQKIIQKNDQTMNDGRIEFPSLDAYGLTLSNPVLFRINNVAIPFEDWDEYLEELEQGDTSMKNKRAEELVEETVVDEVNTLTQLPIQERRNMLAWLDLASQVQQKDGRRPVLEAIVAQIVEKLKSLGYKENKIKPLLTKFGLGIFARMQDIKNEVAPVEGSKQARVLRKRVTHETPRSSKRLTERKASGGIMKNSEVDSILSNLKK